MKDNSVQTIAGGGWLSTSSLMRLRTIQERSKSGRMDECAAKKFQLLLELQHVAGLVPCSGCYGGHYHDSLNTFAEALEIYLA